MDEYPEEKKPLGFPSGCHPICGEQIKLQKWRASTAPKMLLASTRISMTSIYGKFHCPSLVKLV